MIGLPWFCGAVIENVSVRQDPIEEPVVATGLLPAITVPEATAAITIV